jgi:hypothetical protein
MSSSPIVAACQLPQFLSAIPPFVEEVFPVYRVNRKLLRRSGALQKNSEALFCYNGAYLAVFSSLQAYFDTYLRCNEPYLAYYTPKVSCNAALLHCNGHCKPTQHHCNLTMDRCCLYLGCKSLTTTIAISLQKSIVSDFEVIVSLQLANYTKQRSEVA